MPYDITISAAYCPPRHNNKKEDYQSFFSTLGNKFIAGGDYNSKHVLWGSRLTTTKGRELAKLMQEENYYYMSTGTPTYWPTDPQKTPDLLDFFVTKGLSSTYADVTPSFELSSDHTPVIATISSSVIYKQPTPKLHNNKTNWDTYREIIDNNINLSIRIKTPEDLNTTLKTLIDTLQKAARRSTPQQITKIITNNIPVEIKQILKEKRKARNTWHRTHAPADKTKYNQLSNKLKNKLKEMREATLEDYVTNLSRFDHSVWKPIKNLKRPKDTSPPVRATTPAIGPWARSNKEKAELFAEHYSNTFKPHNNDPNDLSEEEESTLTEEHRTLKLTTPKEINGIIKSLSLRKSPGPDQITAKMLKELPRKGFVLLAYIFNGILRMSYWPIALKLSQIITIIKPGKDPSDIASYRPISLTSVISKVFEKILLRRIKDDLTTNTWIPQHQFGFRPGHTTIQQVHRIIDDINKSLEAGNYCTAAFLDVSQAFDRVWHDGLLFKIRKTLRPPYPKLFKSYLNDRYFQTKVGSETSEIYPIEAGVPQGSVLGPMLYVLFTSDIPTSTNTTTGTFADDTAILSSNKSLELATVHLQQHLDTLQDWFKKWRIKINESKSVHITFTLRKKKPTVVHINNAVIPSKEEVKYLGMHLDCKMTWKCHIIKKRKQIDLLIKQMSWLLGRRSKLSLENKILIYKTVIIPIWTYGIELWGCASKSNINIIQRSQSKILRMLVDAPWYVSNETLHQDLNLKFVKEIILDRSRQHMSKIETHENELLQPLREPINNRRLKRTWPNDLI